MWKMAANGHNKNTNSNIYGTLLSILMINMPNYMFFDILNWIK